MNRFLLSGLFLALGGAVQAQSISAPHSDWQGVYLGAMLDGYANTEFNFGAFPDLDGTIEGHQFGGFIGYRHQFGDFVIGGEFDVTTGGTTTTLSLPNMTFEDAIGTRTQFLRLGVEAGYSIGRFLPYGTAGVASLTFEDTANGDNRGLGHFYGFGVDVQTGEYVSVGFEVLRHEFDDFDLIDDFSLETTTYGLNVAVRY